MQLIKQKIGDYAELTGYIFGEFSVDKTMDYNILDNWDAK